MVSVGFLYGWSRTYICYGVGLLCSRDRALLVFGFRVRAYLWQEGGVISNKDRSIGRGL